MSVRLSIAGLLTVCAALAQIRSVPSVAVPPDPNEPITGVVQTLTEQSDRSNGLALMTRARLKLQLHAQRTPSFVISATFTSSAGAGSMTETWMNGQKWRWSGAVGNDSAVRIAGDGLHTGFLRVAPFHPPSTSCATPSFGPRRRAYRTRRARFAVRR